MSAALLAAVAAGVAVACVLPHGLRVPDADQAHTGARPRAAVLSAGTVVVGLVVVGLLAADGPAEQPHGALHVLVERVRPWLGAGALVAAAVPAVLWLRRSARERRTRQASAAEVLQICEDLAGDLAAGSSPDLALQRAARRWPRLAEVAAAQRLGTSVPAAWRALARAPGVADLRVVAAAWEVAERTGAGLADALDVVAAAIRDQQRTQRVVASELASARATARLMAALPVLTLAIGSGAGDPVGFLLRTPAGLALAAAGLALALLGVGWIEAIASSLEREATEGAAP